MSIFRSPSLGALACVARAMVLVCPAPPTALPFQDPVVPVAVVYDHPESLDEDDMCYWVHPTDPALSTVIVTDKFAGKIFVYDLEGTFLWKVDAESRAHRTPIEVGLRQEGRVEIAKGLAPGDVVVAAGIHKVKEGQRVRAATDGTHPVAAEDATGGGEGGRGGSS